MTHYFITGTDTDCGKTVVTCQLVRYFTKNNHRVCALKPIATGCIEQSGQLISEDALQIAQGQGHVNYDVDPWRFKPAISPHLAAKAAGEQISLEALAARCFTESLESFEHVFIEGAGGLMAPLNQQTNGTVQTWLDFLITYPMPVILVVGMRLGCLNHALLTAYALEQAHIPCAGWIANCLDPNMQALSDNIETLKKALSLPLMAIMPHNGVLEVL